jgi:hypothetical protein
MAAAAESSDALWTRMLQYAAESVRGKAVEWLHVVASSRADDDVKTRLLRVQ